MAVMCDAAGSWMMVVVVVAVSMTSANYEGGSGVVVGDGVGDEWLTLEGVL